MAGNRAIVRFSGDLDLFGGNANSAANWGKPINGVGVRGGISPPGDLIHMDEHGAVRFPATALQSVCDHIEAFAHEEEQQVRALLSAGTIEEVRRIWKSQA